MFYSFKCFKSPGFCCTNWLSSKRFFSSNHDLRFNITANITCRHHDHVDSRRSQVMFQTKVNFLLILKIYVRSNASRSSEKNKRNLNKNMLLQKKRQKTFLHSHDDVAVVLKCRVISHQYLIFFLSPRYSLSSNLIF